VAAAGRDHVSVLAKAASATIDITPADKAAFTDALITNTRMTIKTQRVGGRYTLAIRSRTVRETDAVIRQLQLEARKGLFTSTMDQKLRIRSMLMVFQVAELNGVEYSVPSEPLCHTVTDAGEVPPTWLERADAWYNLGDAPHAIIWECVQDFEDKYWIMVEQAKSADFWQPAASI